MKLTFQALIKKYTPISLVSGDKQIALVLQINEPYTNKEVLSGLGDLYDETPNLVQVEIKNKFESLQIAGKVQGNE